MHRCLTIEEILRVIIEHAGIADYNYKLLTNPKTAGNVLHIDYQCLLRLALTCKTFKEPALDELWRRQWGLGNLLKLLPEDLWKETRQQGFPSHRLDFKRAPVAQDWKILESYARRIKRLEMAPIYYKIVTPFHSIPRAVFAAFRRPFLPRLEIFVWSHDAVPADCKEYFDLFLAPSVVDFTLETHSSDYEEHPRRSDDDLKLERLPTFCPKLEQLHLSLSGGVALRAHLPDIVRPLKNLRVLSCQFEHTSFSRDLLRALSSLPALEELQLVAGIYPLNQDVLLLDTLPDSAPDIELPTLRLLALEGTSITSCAMVLETLKLPALDTIEVEAPMQSAEAFRALLEDLNTCCRQDSLKSIRVIDDSVYDLDLLGVAHPVKVAYDVIKPLEKFRYAEKLELNCRFDLDDADIEQIANAWPDLRELYLGRDGWYSSAPTSVTMVGLATLVDRCRKLEEMDLAFNASDPVDFDPQDLRYRNDRIERLGVANSLVLGDPEKLAARLLALFPNLSRIDSASSVADDWDCEVAPYLPLPPEYA